MDYNNFDDGEHIIIIIVIKYFLLQIYRLEKYDSLFFISSHATL